MIKRVVFRRTEHSPAIEQYANVQLVKLEKFLEDEPLPVIIDLILEPSKVHQHHRIELRVKTPNFDRVTHYEHEGMDFYATINHVIDTMYKELHEDKQRLVDSRKWRGRKEEFKKQR